MKVKATKATLQLFRPPGMGSTIYIELPKPEGWDALYDALEASGFEGSIEVYYHDKDERYIEEFGK